MTLFGFLRGLCESVAPCDSLRLCEPARHHVILRFRGEHAIVVVAEDKEAAADLKR